MELITEGMEKINSMKNRELERKLNLQMKQEKKKSILAENEQLDFFQRTFNEKQNFIESLLKKAQTLPKNELPEHFNIVSKELLLLQKYVAASNLFIHNYLMQKCQNVIQELSLRAKELEHDLLPKKRFGFKNKKAQDKEKPINSLDTIDAPSASLSNTKQRKTHEPTIECGFFNRFNEILTLTAGQVAKKDVSLEDLDNCKVYLKGFPSTLHLNRLKNCQIFSGPVSTSIFAEDCQDSTLVVACQQLRLHSSSNVKIYLHVTSRAIMEDCTDITLAPYNWTYDDVEEHFKEAGLDRDVNNWRCIDDFNWLNAERHSPHWRELEETERVKKWII